MAGKIHIFISAWKYEKASAVDPLLSMKKLKSRFGQCQQYRSLLPIQELSPTMKRRMACPACRTEMGKEYRCGAGKNHVSSRIKRW